MGGHARSYPLDEVAVGIDQRAAVADADGVSNEGLEEGGLADDANVGEAV